MASISPSVLRDIVCYAEELLQHNGDRYAVVASSTLDKDKGIYPEHALGIAGLVLLGPQEFGWLADRVKKGFDYARSRVCEVYRKPLWS